MSDSPTAADSSAPPSPPAEAPAARARRWGRWLAGALVLLVALGLVAQHYLDPWLRQTLEKQVATQTHGQYRLHIGALRTSLWERAVRLRQVRLRPAVAVADTLPRLRLDVARLHVTGIGLLALWRKGVVPVDSVVLDSARIEVLALARRPAKNAGKPLHEQLPLKLAGLKIGYLGLLHATGQYLPRTPAAAQFGRADLGAHDLRISPAGAADSQRLGYAAAWQLRLRHAQAQTAGHQLALGSLRLSTDDKNLQLDSLRVQPNGAGPAGGPRLALALPRLRLTGIDAALLQHQHRLRADSVLVISPQLTAALPASAAPGPSKSFTGYLRSLDVAHLAVRHGYARVAGTPTAPTIRGLEVAGTAIHFDSAGRSTRPVFYAKAWEVALGPSQATVAAHALALGSLRFSTQAGTFGLRSVRIRPPGPGQGKSGGVRVDLTLPGLALTGLDAAALRRRRFRAQSLVLNGPRLLFTPPVQPPPPVWKLLAKAFQRTDLAQLRVRHADVRIGRWRHSPHAQGLNVTAKAIRVDSLANTEPRRMAYALAWQAEIGRLSSPFDPPFYRASTGPVHLDTDARILRFENMRLKPRYSAVGMNLHKGYQAPAITINVRELKLVGLDFPGLFQHGDFRLARATAQSPSVLIASDGRGPINPNLSKISPEEMRKLPVTVDVRRLDLVNGNLYTTYRSPLTPLIGQMRITRFNGRFFNLSNDPKHQTPATPLTGQATTYLQDQCRLDARASMYLLDPRGRHRVWGAFGPGEFGIINPMTVPTRLVAFKSGSVQRIRFDMRADRQGIRGTMCAEYTNLQMSLLGYEEDEQKIKKTIIKRVLSKAANVIVIRDENPRKRGKLVEGRTISRREPRFSMFSLWRQGIVSGLFDNVGVPQKLAQKLSESADEAPLPK